MERIIDAVRPMQDYRLRIAHAVDGRILAMRRYIVPVLFSLSLFTYAPVIGAAFAPAAPGFTIQATNTSMSASGSAIPFVLTSINGYTGSFGVDCMPANPPAGARLPYCGGGPAYRITLNANATAKGAIGLSAGPAPLAPAALNRSGHGAEVAWALASVPLIGSGFWRRKARWLSILLLSAGALAGLTGLDACAGGPPTLTPGTYAYTITAADASTNATASTTVNVTVPPGIPTTTM